jgi:uncharacterized protein (DUF2235 family)
MDRTFELPFRRKTYLPIYAPAADHIRHAVSIDERRLKFKPALFCHDKEVTIHESTRPKDIKEVGFLSYLGLISQLVNGH